MPITEELNNIRKFESVGFSHEQAEALTETFEQTQVNSHESLKEFIRNEFERFDNKLCSEIKDIRNELKQDIKDLEVRIAYSQKDLLIKLFGIIVGTVGMAVTILKLFP